MRNLLTILFMIGAFTIAGNCQNQNPFFDEWKTPFGVPPFSQIKTEHYLPAYKQAMADQKREIDAIIRNTAPPTFDNTILALDKSGALLDKVSSVFSGLNSANTNKEMQEIAKQLSPIITQHADDISLNPGLFKKVSVVYNNREKSGLDKVQLRVVEESYKNFVRGGANLDSASQKRLRELNKEISLLQITFGQNLLAETNSYKLIIEDKKDLAGLPEPLIATAYETAASNPETKGKWVFTLQNPSVMPFLQFAENRNLREKIFTAYINRCNNENDKDNKKLIANLVELRNEKAKLLGFNDFASYALDNRMAKNSENVYNLLNQIWTPANSKGKEELKSLQEMFTNEIGQGTLEGWDWRYYNEKLLKQRFDLEEESLKPFFQLENVLEGVFFVANKLYGISFTEVKDAPVYYSGVKLYECKDVDGSHLGVLYFDFYPRQSKRGGAWCGSYRPQSYSNGKRVAPVMTIVCNFTAPSAGEPALLSADETETLFHEFGHALHGLLKNVKYRELASVPRDFVELPSQIMEHWAFEPDVLKVYARHYKDGTVIPMDLVEKIKQSEKFGQGFATTEYLAACFLDMDYHTISNQSMIDVAEFEAKSMNTIGLIAQIPPRYRSTYFQHSMTGGYTAGYYSYIWAEVLDADAFEAFTETGDIFNQTVAAKFRKDILERGGSKDAMEMYLDFRGKQPGIEPLLNNRGLN